MVPPKRFRVLSQCGKPRSGRGGYTARHIT